MRRLALNSAVILAAVILFTKGFLLMKLETGRKSPPCSDQIDENGVDKCWRLPKSSFKYDKVVILIIDALRYDFAFYNDGSMPKQVFQNNMPIFHETMLEKGCEKAKLWRFKADAPTTTMQRLKGLTTGSLPTFIDLSRNFASSEITEDNILDQFLASGKNITFMGDDTWMGLFPGRFNKAFPYPSFDVKDLHLVDNGILEHLLPEIQAADWQLLIAHFLGVDHCGHRYGPYHSEMPLKLRQMNDVVKNVIDTIDDNTLLLVMGDHGMTHTGDHGGETFNEVNAALFAYSPTGAFKKCSDDEPKHTVVSQVDIVPTLSLLLQTSIPFANLGVVIGEMLPQQSNRYGANFQDALLVNARQIHTFIRTYQEITNSLPQEDYESLLVDYEELEGLSRSNIQNQNNEEKFLKYIQSAKEMCQLVWAKFNISMMLSALSFLVLWVIMNLNLSQIVSKMCFVLLVVTFSCTILSFTSLSDASSIFSLVVCCSTFILLCMSCLMSVFGMLFQQLVLELAVPVGFLLMYSASFTSNSFILNEDMMTLYLFVSVLLYIAFQSMDDADMPANAKLKVVGRRKSIWNSRKPANALSDMVDLKLLPNGLRNGKAKKVMVYSFVGVLSARLAFTFRSCRAEQFWCFDDASGTELGAKVDSSTITVLCSCVTLVISIKVGISFLSPGHKLKSSFGTRSILLSATLCAFSWILHLLPTETASLLPDWYSIVIPRCVYVILMAFFIFPFIGPISSCLPPVIKPSEENDTSNHNGGEKVHHSSNPLKDELQDVSVAFSSSVLKLVFGFVCFFSLLLGPGLATAIPLWMISSLCALQIMSTALPQKSVEYVPFGHIVVWNMMASYWWFATGHQPSISSIRWDAAFVGFQGNHVTNVIPALLLLLDTFSMQILSSVSLPLLVFWSSIRNSSITNDGSSQGVLEPIPSPRLAVGRWKVLDDMFLKHFSFHVAKMIGCMVSATLHRRHLMVWWIFAPRFLFEALSVIIVLSATLFSYVFIRTVQRRLGVVSSFSIKW